MAYPMMRPRQKFFNGTPNMGSSFGSSPMISPGYDEPATAPRMSRNSTYTPQSSPSISAEQDWWEKDPSYSPPGHHSKNFLRSVAENNGKPDPFPDPSYLITGGGRNAGVLPLPGGANISMIGGTGTSTRAASGGKSRDRAQIIKDLLGPPEHIPYQYDMSKDSNGALVNPGKIIGGGGTKYRMTMEDAEKGADEQLGRIAGPGNPVGMAPPITAPGATTQPAAPSMIQPATQPTTAPASPQMYPGSALGTNAVQLTEQAAREMWRNIRTRPGMTYKMAQEEFNDMTHKYGVGGSKLLDHWDNGGTMDTFDFGGHMQPGTRVPLSMLGPDNGLDPSQKYGAPRMSTPGPSISTPGTYVTGGPEAGYTPATPQFAADNPGAVAATHRQMLEMKPPTSSVQTATAQPAQARKLTPELATRILQQVNGDKDKARQLARQQGYQF